MKVTGESRSAFAKFERMLNQTIWVFLEDTYKVLIDKDHKGVTNFNDKSMITMLDLKRITTGKAQETKSGATELVKV